ncbi:hypothetical protein HY501_00405 [Candidatus Woesearchaeota archaeon]|nr:hypothetical protein [Candidatus Woesearchaeota archaeon]
MGKKDSLDQSIEEGDPALAEGAMDGEYIEQIYPVNCRGRNNVGKPALKDPVSVAIRIYKSPDTNMISSDVNCQYITGGHSQRCKASHPGIDKSGKGIHCPYAFDILPHE